MNPFLTGIFFRWVESTNQFSKYLFTIHNILGSQKPLKESSRGIFDK